VTRAGVTVKNPRAHFQVSHGTEIGCHHREQVGHFPLAVGSCSASSATQYRT